LARNGSESSNRNDNDVAPREGVQRSEELAGDRRRESKSEANR